ncbi:MAG: FG-GAP repeat domain-containing protein, partial [Rubricella sp.]
VHRLPRVLVFEDLAPRLADVTGDGLPEIITVEAHRTLGARLAVWTAEGRLAATPHIGRAFRWLAPVGVGDFDGDGHPDIAYVETPHLGRTLRFWTYRDGALHQIASAPGYTNHRIGEDFITSAVRSCTGMDEAVTVNAGYTRILASQVRDGMVVSRDVGPFRGRGSVEAAARC